MDSPRGDPASDSSSGSTSPLGVSDDKIKTNQNSNHSQPSETLQKALANVNNNNASAFSKKIEARPSHLANLAHSRDVKKAKKQAFSRLNYASLTELAAMKKGLREKEIIMLAEGSSPPLSPKLPPPAIPAKIMTTSRKPSTHTDGSQSPDLNANRPPPPKPQIDAQGNVVIPPPVPSAPKPKPPIKRNRSVGEMQNKDTLKSQSLSTTTSTTTPTTPTTTTTSTPSRGDGDPNPTLSPRNTTSNPSPNPLSNSDNVPSSVDTTPVGSKIQRSGSLSGEESNGDNSTKKQLSKPLPPRPPPPIARTPSTENTGTGSESESSSDEKGWARGAKPKAATAGAVAVPVNPSSPSKPKDDVGKKRGAAPVAAYASKIVDGFDWEVFVENMCSLFGANCPSSPYYRVQFAIQLIEEWEAMRLLEKANSKAKSSKGSEATSSIQGRGTLLFQESEAIFHKPLTSLSTHQDLARLIKNYQVTRRESGQSKKQSVAVCGPFLSNASKKESIATLLLTLARVLGEEDTAGAQITKHLDECVPSDESLLDPTGLGELFSKYIGEDTKTVKVLKAGTQGIVAPCITHFKNALGTLTFNAARGGWEVIVNISPDEIVITHKKRECATPDAQEKFGQFDLEWGVEFVFDTNMQNMKYLRPGLISFSGGVKARKAVTKGFRLFLQSRA